MSLISSALFAVSASLDALLLGLVFGIRRIRISLIQNLCISFITLLGSFLAIRLGNLIPLFTEASLFAPGFITSVGCGILLGIGLYYVIKALFTAFLDDKTPATDKKATPADLTLSRLLLLSASLTVNNMGIGFGAGMAGLPLRSTCVFIFLFSVLFLHLGNYLGKNQKLRIKEYWADLFCGLLLIMLGIWRLLL
ncbi:MAG: manganese efflux pump [Lachnospiraceae bacterium]|nr:manganese efflux pump [Lachnospiraceae bacterium]